MLEAEERESSKRWKPCCGGEIVEVYRIQLAEMSKRRGEEALSTEVQGRIGMNRRNKDSQDKDLAGRCEDRILFQRSG